MSLSGALTATVDDDAVRFRFAVENGGDEAAELHFSDGQRFDVTVEADGEEVWRYGAGRMFAQALGSETLAPGERAEFEAEWPDPSAGEYEARAELTATDADCGATAAVTV
jgi:hypothetical protein